MKTPRPPKKIAFLQFERPLGAALMATPVFASLRASLPSAELTALCGPMALQVLKHNPNLDQLVDIGDPLTHPITCFRRALSHPKLRCERFDYVIADGGNARTKVSLISFAVRNDVRLGFSVRPWLLNVHLDYDTGLSVAANNLRIVEALGYSMPVEEPQLYFSPEDDRHAQALRHELGQAGSKKLVVIATQVSGGYPEKRRWRDDWFAQAADQLAALGMDIAFLGTAAESAAIDRIRGLMRGPSVTLAGRLSITQLAAFLARADTLITLDTGTLHAARAVALPAVVIARPWQAPHEWLPIRNNRYQILSKEDVVRKSQECHTFSAPYTIDEISVAEVVDAVVSLQGNYPADEDARALRVAARLSSAAPRRY